jgi:hypothetical protein
VWARATNVFRYRAEGVDPIQRRQQDVGSQIDSTVRSGCPFSDLTLRRVALHACQLFDDLVGCDFGPRRQRVGRPTILMRRAGQSIARMSLERPNGLPRSVGEGADVVKREAVNSRFSGWCGSFLRRKRELADAGGPGLSIYESSDGSPHDCRRLPMSRCPRQTHSKYHAAGATNDRFSWAETSAPMNSKSTRTRPLSSSSARRHNVSANGPDRMRSF